MQYIFDSSALLAYLQKEKGSQRVAQILKSSDRPFIHAINFLEVNYKLRLNFPERWDVVKSLLESLPLTVSDLWNQDILQYANHLKSKYPMAIADAIGVSFSRFMNLPFLTCDRGELEPVAKKEDVVIEFLR